MLGAHMDVQSYLTRMQHEVGRLDTRPIEALAEAIYQRYLSGRFVYIVGNGGSAANASHLCEDLGKSSVIDFENQRRLKVLSLTDNTPYILAWANDTSYERIFVEQLRNFGEPGDLLIAISGSGNSPNILRAVEWANAHQIETFGVTGFDGGQLKRIAQQSLHCALDDMGMVESLHLVAFHYVLDDLHGRINCRKHQAA
ncbi:MAG: D-sedoheptulose-7-phosphate isomerase [Planctomycetaceae bacterium]